MLYTYETGNPNDPAILFLHGGGLSSLSWQPVIERLPEFHCLAPDLPEQGRSKDIPYSISGSADAVAEIIRQHVPSKKANVVALSLGGPVAFTLLRTAPELVDHVMLSGCSGQISRWITDIGKSTIWMYKFFKPDYLVRETIRQQGIPLEYKGLVADDLRISLSPDFMRHYMAELSTWQLPERIEQPLLIAVGEKEMKAAFSFARSYLKRFPNACGVTIPGAGHVWSLQNPDLFANTLRAWVTGQALPEGLKKL